MALAAALAIGCGNVGHDKPGDDAAVADGPPSGGALGSRDNPARTCGELREAGLASGAYWVRDPRGQSPPFQVYCEQDLNGGGWAMVENSVRRDDGTTTTFWQFSYADRLTERGSLAADQNYYNGSLYLLGTEYMDVFVDLAGKAVGAAVMTATGFNPTTMRFMNPALSVGLTTVFQNQFASGWASVDRDDDVYAEGNCATTYANVAQHYSACWTYNLGADADADRFDGGVGPHVHIDALAQLGLMAQPEGGAYSQVRRIARFTRWR